MTEIAIPHPSLKQRLAEGVAVVANLDAAVVDARVEGNRAKFARAVAEWTQARDETAELLLTHAFELINGGKRGVDELRWADAQAPLSGSTTRVGAYESVWVAISGLGRELRGVSASSDRTPYELLARTCLNGLGSRNTSGNDAGTDLVSDAAAPFHDLNRKVSSAMRMIADPKRRPNDLGPEGWIQTGVTVPSPNTRAMWWAGRYAALARDEHGTERSIGTTATRMFDIKEEVRQAGQLVPDDQRFNMLSTHPLIAGPLARAFWAIRLGQLEPLPDVVAVYSQDGSHDRIPKELVEAVIDREIIQPAEDLAKVMPRGGWAPQSAAIDGRPQLPG